MFDDPTARDLRGILRRAGEEALSRLRSRAVWRKEDGSPVTDADLAAERVILDGLREAWPDDAIVSEEAGGVPDPSRPTWFVDPIDGTAAFAAGLAHWGPTVCRVVDGRLDVGAFWVPRLQEFWFARAGGGAWLDGERLAPVETETEASAIAFLPSRAHSVGPIHWPGKQRCLGSTAAHLAFVASGGGAAAIVPRWALWDVGCGILLVREAGREVVNLDGSAWSWRPGDHSPLLAGTPRGLELLLSAAKAVLPRPAGT